ncbi:MAG: DUF364 domain-containing protein [Bacteroidales bacterium]|nr:DUF364 domain-containing protein [Bacteroidales bacterium]
MDEPIRYFLNREGFNRNEIKDYVIGEKYVGIMHQNGQIGVCATLGTDVSDDLLTGNMPDTTNPSHRIILNAWFNAVCNYSQRYDDIIDIFDSIDFTKQGKIVMVGYFESLHEKFRRCSIDLEVFDIQKESSILTGLNRFEKSLYEADTIILTGTTIFNNTFMDVIGKSSEGANIFLLGPSNILSEEMFKYRNIKVVFGSMFEPGDRQLFDKIKAGKGTRGFIDNLKKVYITKDIN